MKKSFILFALLGIMACACNHGSAEFTTETANFADTTTYLTFGLKVDLPVAKDEATKTMRKNLIQIMKEQLEGLVFTEENAPELPECKGDDINELVNLYGELTAGHVGSLAKEDADSIDPDYDWEFPGWEFDIALNFVSQTDNYAVFESTDFTYMAGAHGGISGVGPMTFDKSTGKLFTDFIIPGVNIEGVLIEGILSYYHDSGDDIAEEDLKERLFLPEDGIIPIPAYAPEPTAEGLRFTYQQYEIACYADGMITFVVPYDVAHGFLTVEALELLSEHYDMY